MYGTSWFHLFFISQILKGNLLNFMISINFQQLKKIKFRSFSSHFAVFRELICLFTKYKKWEKHIYDLFNFIKNAVTFKTSYIYQTTNFCSEIPLIKILIIQKQVNWFAIQINGLVSKWNEVLLKGFFGTSIIKKKQN